MTMKFYKCGHCGNIITKLTDSGVPTFCCGQKMDELVAGTTDAAVEKHVPVYTVEGSKVSVVVGDVIHPMAEEHWIEWIVLETKQGYQFKKLNPGEEPKACFELCEGDEVVAVYEHCNLHGLWKK